jgi:hypothetical protein
MTINLPFAKTDSLEVLHAVLGEPIEGVPSCMCVHRVPSGLGWVHEMKHDGYRLQVRRDGDQGGAGLDVEPSYPDAHRASIEAPVPGVDSA